MKKGDVDMKLNLKKFVAYVAYILLVAWSSLYAAAILIDDPLIWSQYGEIISQRLIIVGVVSAFCFKFRWHNG